MTDQGMSAAASRKTTRRSKPVSLMSPPARYTVRDAKTNTEYSGTFKVVADLCPAVKASTLKGRLDSGERDLVKLRRAPEPNRNKKWRGDRVCR